MYCTRPRGLDFYIVIYMEMLKKSSSPELLHQMRQYSAWIIPRSLGQRDSDLFPGVTIKYHAIRGHSFIKVYIAKVFKISSYESLA